ncbi:WD40/YVTN/BNR-like repeat-containing protein [Sphingobacterium sp. SYP-B4668]|uniref:WD40/YVTN/BNR-like repeat-containing protein n=1 Tax=Sphingobacterium sp. SYP-B4668 TaxID=2996035 RepID=UPI0022DD49F3|nr:oxidoreductase [Sphingobacterium sp. SYP-B4668]
MWVLAPQFLFAQTITPLVTGINSSFRGLSIVSDSVLWVSGSNGTVGRSEDAGKTWAWINPTGYEKYDFRDIEAFDEQRAIVMSVGSPAIILQTLDAGKNWSAVYTNDHPDIFLDGLSFWDDQNGIVYGDPIHHALQILKTQDGGMSWQNISANQTYQMAVGEASFAASGTTVKTMNNGQVWIATGGTVSHVYYSDDYGQNWTRSACPIVQGKPSTGVFSIDFWNEKTGIAVGGDYLQDQIHTNNVLLTTDAGRSWQSPATSVHGFKSSVIYVSADTILTTGTSGTDISNDGGQHWTNIDTSSFNVIQKAKKGNAIYLTGSKGSIAKLQLR